METTARPRAHGGSGDPRRAPNASLAEQVAYARLPRRRGGSGADALRILLIEDNPADAALVHEYLEEDPELAYELEHAESLAEARDTLARFEPDLALIDLTLPDGRGLETFGSVRAWGQAFPIVILSGIDDTHLAVEAVRRGAQDYVPKSAINGPLLTRVLRYAIERRRTERAIEARERRWRAMVEHSSDVIALLDPELKPSFVSESVVNATGFTAAELLGRDLLAFVHPEDRAGIEAALQDTLTGETSPITTYRFRHKHGGWRWWEVVATNLMDDPAVGAIVVNARVIEERMRVEEERTHLLAQLAERVKELKMLHETALILQDEDQSLRAVFDRIVERMPAAWRVSDALAARIRYKHEGAMIASQSPNFRETPWMLSHDFETSGPGWGTIEVAYLRDVDPAGSGPFLTEERELLESLTEMVRAHLDRRHGRERNEALTESLSAQLARLAALQKISDATLNSSDVRQTLDVILEEATRQLEVDAATIFLFDPDEQALNPTAGRGFRVREIEHPPLRLGQGVGGAAALERKPLAVLDVRDASARFEPPGMVEREGFASYYAIPLIAKGRLQGLLSLFHRSHLEFPRAWREVASDIAQHAAVAIENASLFEDLQRSNAELHLSYDRTIEGWARALDLKDEETAGHSQRVTRLTVALARRLGVAGEDLANVRRGALLHDIGKMGVPDAILLKPGKLDDHEWDIMKRHTTYAKDFLAGVPFLEKALDIPYAHHERWDGRGYPRGLAGEDIPLAARIFAVVDVFDALTSERPYREAWSPADARAHIEASAGTHFDPRVVAGFLALLDDVGIATH